MPKQIKHRYGHEPAKGRFATIPFELMKSLAYKNLSPVGICVLLILKSRFNGGNNGEISLSCREIEKLSPMSRNTAGRALNELETKGFIKTTRKGYFTTNMASTYELTMDYNKGEMSGTNEWKYWKPGIDCRNLPKNPLESPVPWESQRVPDVGRTGSDTGLANN